MRITCRHQNKFKDTSKTLAGIKFLTGSKQFRTRGVFSSPEKGEKSIVARFGFI
jgi:hypothetical protein